MRLLAKQPIIVCMRADPEPYEAVCCFDRQGAVVGTDANGPKAADLLEVKRWVPGVLLQAGVRLIGEVPDIRW